MTRRWSLYLPLLLATVLFSCAEESIEPNSEGKLIGDYDFVSLSVDGTTVSETIFPDETTKVVAEVIYHTKNNTGTYTFDGKKIIGMNVGYSVDTTLKAVYYVDGVKDDEFELPFAATIPPLNSAGTYKLIGEDSLYFEGGFISPPSGGGAPMVSGPSGARFVVTGNTLILTAKFSTSTSTTQMGITTRSITNGSTTVRMKKR
ncbi:hypothetical protein [Chitinophaga barathri]|uniref:Lipocalin-like domain-containing protein n=1 Tax=Chitinophaga barathri TaxID=1647451 RepID=A0A3N4MTM7_9BACT|nr:hypothetical protein [Chitinophaga barathri]RPD42879.1 hypothetical protein EG028_00850 [Chitinophaga barathri]